MTASLIGGPSNGTISFNGDGSFVYTPNSSFTGVDSFSYTFTAGADTSNIATVIIYVNDDVLMVTATGTAVSPSDVQLKTRLEEVLGFTVTLIDDHVITEADPEPYQLLVVTEDSNSGLVEGMQRSRTPILTCDDSYSLLGGASLVI